MIDNYIREKNLNNGKNYIKVKEIKEIQKKTLNTPSPTRDTTFAQIIDKDDYSNKQNLISFINENNFEIIVLGDYINSGSAGVVYRATYKGKNKQQVAIKFLINKKHKENREKKENETKNVNQEIAISKKLHNKNIIEIYAYIKKRTNEIFYIRIWKIWRHRTFFKKITKKVCFR